METETDVNKALRTLWSTVLLENGVRMLIAFRLSFPRGGRVTLDTVRRLILRLGVGSRLAAARRAVPQVTVMLHKSLLHLLVVARQVQLGQR